MAETRVTKKEGTTQLYTDIVLSILYSFSSLTTLSTLLSEHYSDWPVILTE